ISPNDDVLNYASEIVRSTLGGFFLKRGYTDKENSWIVNEVSVCLVRQAQRGRLILIHAIDWEEGKEQNYLECERVAYQGKLNCYEVIWLVCHNSADAYQGIVDFDLERCGSSLVIYNG